MPINHPNSSICPCGTGLDYTACCGPFHSWQAFPATAEQLMRSRFTAYVLKNTDYLLQSWVSAKRPAALDLSTDTAQWHKLQILHCHKGRTKDNKGTVEFKAYYYLDADEYVMHENSRFIKHGQRWLYVDGIIKSAGKLDPRADSRK